MENKLKKGGKSLVGILQDLTLPTYPGPPSSLTPIHIYKALHTIEERGPIGRASLSSELALGEGAVRTLLNRLKGARLIDISRKGCTLSRKGRDIYEAFKERILGFAQLKARSLALDHFNVGVHLRGAASKVTNGLKQRDAAVRGSASGAVTLTCKMGKIIFPDAQEEKELDPLEPLVAELVKYFKLKNNDVVIVASGSSKDRAELGALTAALDLLD